jgi:hypothetical protein
LSYRSGKDALARLGGAPGMLSPDGSHQQCATHPRSAATSAAPASNRRRFSLVRTGAGSVGRPAAEGSCCLSRCAANKARRQLPGEELEGDVPLQPGVPGEEHLPHAALRQRAHQPVLAQGVRQGERRRTGRIERRPAQAFPQDALDDLRGQIGGFFKVGTGRAGLAQGCGSRVGPVLRQALEPCLALRVRFQPPDHGVGLGLGQQSLVEGEQYVVRRLPLLGRHEQALSRTQPAGV